MIFVQNSRVVLDEGAGAVARAEPDLEFRLQNAWEAAAAQL